MVVLLDLDSVALDLADLTCDAEPQPPSARRAKARRFELYVLPPPRCSRAPPNQPSPQRILWRDATG
jgi:hypothetical protein|eukprot:COSAG06_NODE_863_length_11877_cov_16.370012_2_plen_67_part_00